ncbi:MAG: hypothetical protein ABFQ65_03495 [Nanoarchaeota archaeon]
MSFEDEKWIHDIDEYYSFFQDIFIQATISKGANSIQKLMGVNYLSQFEDLNGEFVVRSVFIPDFKIGIIPYSSAFLELYNDHSSRLNVDLIGDGQNLRIRDFANLGNIDNLVKNGAQFSRLYLKNKKNLERFDGDDKKLFRAVRSCYLRDEKIIKNLSYSNQSFLT